MTSHVSELQELCALKANAEQKAIDSQIERIYAALAYNAVHNSDTSHVTCWKAFYERNMSVAFFAKDLYPSTVTLDGDWLRIMQEHVDAGKAPTAEEMAALPYPEEPRLPTLWESTVDVVSKAYRRLTGAPAAA